MSYNKIIIMGNLGRDPELRYTPQGVAVCSFSIASSRKVKDKSGEMQDVTTWFKVTFWREKAENAAKYLTKGSPAYVEGYLSISEWTDRDNNNRYTLEVNGTEFQFVPRSGNGESRAADEAVEEEDDATEAPAPAAKPAAGKKKPAAAPAEDANDDIDF